MTRESIRDGARQQRVRISKSKDGRYYFVLKARDGHVLVISETYTTKQSAESGIRARTPVRPKLPGAGTMSFQQRPKCPIPRRPLSAA